MVFVRIENYRICKYILKLSSINQRLFIYITVNYLKLPSKVKLSAIFALNDEPKKLIANVTRLIKHSNRIFRLSPAV